MSQRLARALLRLYPGRIRRRYGPELLELQDQLRAEGELSRVRLIRDALTGALLARSARRRVTVLSAVALLAAMVVVGITLTGSHHQSSRPPIAVKAPLLANAERTVPNYSPDEGSTCFVGSGMSCSLQPCAVAVAVARRARAVCVGSSRGPHAGALPIAVRHGAQRHR